MRFQILFDQEPDQTQRREKVDDTHGKRPPSFEGGVGAQHPVGDTAGVRPHQAPHNRQEEEKWLGHETIQNLVVPSVRPAVSMKDKDGVGSPNAIFVQYTGRRGRARLVHELFEHMLEAQANQKVAVVIFLKQVRALCAIVQDGPAQ